MKKSTIRLAESAECGVFSLFVQFYPSLMNVVGPRCSHGYISKRPFLPSKATIES